MIEPSFSATINVLAETLIVAGWKWCGRWGHVYSGVVEGLSGDCQVFGDLRFGIVGEGFGAAIFVMFILGCGLDHVSHSGELGGQAAAEVAHHEVDEVPEGLVLGELASICALLRC